MTGHPVAAPIVVADDDPNIRLVIREYLAAARIENPVIEASGGHEALDIVRRVRPRPALLLLDVMMPDGDGIEALAALHDDGALARLPVVMLSGSTDGYHIEEAHRLGASSYLVKPVGLGALTDVIRNLGLPWMLHPVSPAPREVDFTDAPLLDRDAFLETLRYRVRKRERRPGATAMMIVGIDRFTAVNHALGNEAGDALLDAAGARLQGALGPGDVAARLGGDEFGILAEVADAPSALALSAHLLDTLREAFTLPGADTPVVVTASAGVDVVAPGAPATEPLSPLRRAETAMRIAKAGGGGRSQVFVPSLHTSAEDRYRLEIDLAGAVGRDELELRYQPVVDLGTGEVPGVEALVRWKHPEHGLLTPNHFIELAEDSGIIHALGGWVLEEACRQLKRWSGGAATAGLYVAVNLSPHQLRRPELVDTVVDLLSETGTDPASVHLEVTESALAPREDDICDRLEKLRAAGVTVALDDFGTGHSSLARLGNLPIDVVKIDQSFTAGIADGPEHWTIANAIVNLARRLGKETLAEGIEDHAQLAHLRSLHVEQGQGFLFAEPLEAHVLEDWLEARSLARAT